MSSPHLFEVLYPCFWGISQMHGLGFHCGCAFPCAADMGNVGWEVGRCVCTSGGLRMRCWSSAPAFISCDSSSKPHHLSGTFFWGGRGCFSYQISRALLKK